MSALADLLVACKLYSTRWRRASAIRASVRDPGATQHEVLRRILQENRETRFGREHGFAAIRDYEMFKRQVPVSEFEALRPYIDAEIASGEAALTAEPPSGYARTSGTTGRPKDVPLTPSHLAALRRIHETAIAYQHRTCPGAFAGSILAVVSPAEEGKLANGKPYGSASGMVARNTPAAVAGKFVVPAPVLSISDSRVKYLLILRLALARPDITYIGVANPTTLLTLIKLYREHRRELIDDVRRGTFILADKVPAEVMAGVRDRIQAQAQRAAQLEQMRASHGEARIADLWPALRLIVTWTCASAGIAADALKRELGPDTRVLELGYISSEFRGTVTLGRRAGSGLPTLDTHFFEFVERARWDNGDPEFLTLDRLRKGVDYYMVVTTPSGLYRYFINDLVRVRGHLHRTPLLQFVQKGKGVTNITGEKLYEAQMLDAVRTVMSGQGCAARFVMTLADEAHFCYRLFVEPDAMPTLPSEQLAAKVDARLREINVEYEAKRESGRLGPLLGSWLASGTGEAYKQHCVARGQREGQFKIVALTYAREFDFDFKPFSRREKGGDEG